MAKKKKAKQDPLASLSEADKKKVTALAMKMRKAALRKSKEKRRKNTRHFDDMATRERRTGKVDDSLDHWLEKALSKLGETAVLEQDDRELFEGVIVQLSRGGGILLHEGEYKKFHIKPELLMVQKTAMAVGEEILFSQADENLLVEQILPRRQIFSRPDPIRPKLERTIAVNIDNIVIVSTVAQPKFNPYFIDRLLLAVQQTNARAVLCLNKIDLLEDETVLEEIQVYRDLGIDVFLCSATEGTGVKELESFLDGSTCVFVGTSGVGKSSLLNALEPELNVKTAENREKAEGRGRHTTVMAQMYLLQSGIKFIDTPGVREFGLVDMELRDVQFGFKEFIPFIPCKFNDCMHTHEKGCRVKQAVEDDEISLLRYESYLKIIDSMQDQS